MKKKHINYMVLLAVAMMIGVVLGYVVLIRGSIERTQEAKDSATRLLERLEEENEHHDVHDVPEKDYHDELLQLWEQSPDLPPDAFSPGVVGP